VTQLTESSSDAAGSNSTTSGSVLVPFETSSRAAQVEQAIRLAILRGELNPGEQLVERRLAQMLNVSKTPVREALKRLSTTGLLSAHTSQKTFVAEATPEKIQNVYLMRSLLEPEATRMATERMTEADLAKIRDALEVASDAGLHGDYADLTIANRRFHHTIYAPCGNDFMIQTLDQLEDHVALFSVWGWRQQATWKSETDEHVAIFEAISCGRGDEAAGLVRQHIDNSAKTLLAAVDIASGRAREAMP
jgi:DNA-binding GntR family transcriptional regulator